MHPVARIQDNVREQINTNDTYADCWDGEKRISLTKYYPI